MSRKSDKEFWAGRTQTRWRIKNTATGRSCEISASNYMEAIIDLGWRPNDCIVVNLGKKQQLAKPKWYERDHTIERKDQENE